MASTYSNLKIQLMATGENSGTWGNVTNVNLGTALEEAIVGSTDVTFSSGTVTLTLTDSNASQPARNLRLNLTGTSGGAQNLVVPAIEKVYLVNNGCADAITVKNSSGTGIAVPAGKTMWVYNDGTNVVDAVNHLTSLTLGTPLATAQGGTGTNSTTFANLQSNVSGILPTANGGTGANSLANANIVQSNVATTMTALQTFNGSTSEAAIKFLNAKEAVTISGSALTGTLDYDLSTQSVYYSTANASANWTVNFRTSSGTTLNAAMSNGESFTTALLATQGATAYYPNVTQIDGTTSGVTVKWQGGSAPTGGNINSIDVYAYTIVKTGSATFTILASQVAFA